MALLCASLSVAPRIDVSSEATGGVVTYRFSSIDPSPYRVRPVSSTYRVRPVEVPPFAEVRFTAGIVVGARVGGDPELVAC